MAEEWYPGSDPRLAEPVLLGTIPSQSLYQGSLPSGASVSLNGFGFFSANRNKPVVTVVFKGTIGNEREQAVAVGRGFRLCEG
jgi:hypothetical protein